MASSLSESVFGYQRDRRPLPFSPSLMKEAPSARTPARLVRFNTRVRKPRSRTVPEASFCSFCRRSSVGSNSSTRFAKASPSCSAACQNAATSRSSSIMIACSTSGSMTAVSDAIPPPAKGSMRILGFVVFSHSRMCGTSQVLPPGYRSGLRCGTVETLAACRRERGISPAAAWASSGARSMASDSQGSSPLSMSVALVLPTPAPIACGAAS